MADRPLRTPDLNAVIGKQLVPPLIILHLLSDDQGRSLFAGCLAGEINARAERISLRKDLFLESLHNVVYISRGK